MNEHSPAPSPTGIQPGIAQPDDHAFRLLVESVKDYGIFMLTPAGYVASWNAGAERIKGYRAEEIIGKHFSLFYPEEAIARHWPEHELQFAAEAGRFEDEGWRLRKDGSRFWANVVIGALRENGRLVGYSKVTRDLTERREQEERLKQSEERFRLMVESVEDYAMFMIDPDGIVMSWNVGAKRIKGYTSNEIIGRSFRCFYSQEDLLVGKPERLLEFALRHGTAREEGWRIRKDGSRFPADVVITALHDASGQLRGFAKITRDITQSKRIETLEMEGRRLNEFLAMLAHELRNPLAPIRNATSLLGIGTIGGERLEWCRNVLERQTTHLTRLVDDLLDVSRITRGKISIDKREIALTKVIHGAVETCLPLIQARKHELKLTLPPQEVRLEGDLTRLVQVIANLLNNAAKYTASGGVIELSATVEGPRAAIRVKDNGLGMPPELVGKVFDLFQQGERGLDRSEGGLGIGLALVERIVAMHGGMVHAYSEGSGCGSEFTVWLPILADAVPTAPEPAGDAAATDIRPRRVLVVDDNRDAAATMVMAIEALGHEAQAVHTGTAAAEAAARYMPHLVLLDIGLPGMNGYDVARQFRASPELCRIRLVAATGYGQAQDRRQAREAGFDDFLVKPIGLEQLRAAIASAM